MSGAMVAPLPTAEALPEHLRLALTYVTAKKFIKEELSKVGFTGQFDSMYGNEGMARIKEFRSTRGASSGSPSSTVIGTRATTWPRPSRCGCA
tara:strand:+ start:146 stop:424 length:279 start_codon:yes stop_codon:yes gene_type:complete